MPNVLRPWAQESGLREYYEKRSKDELIRKLMLRKCNGPNTRTDAAAELRTWVEEHPDVEQRIRNVLPQNRERTFVNSAKSEAMDQTVRPNGNGVRM